VCIHLPTPSSGSSLESSALSSFHNAFYAINHVGSVVIKVIVSFADVFVDCTLVSEFVDVLKGCVEFSDFGRK
ncbi:16984_t:CDS:2, partial [Cetraspora pellucida]